VETPTHDPSKILIVDDDATLQAMFWRAMRAAGLEAIALIDGSRAFEVAVEEEPALILLDIEMPDADGRDILRDLKRDPRTKRIPVFMYTGMQSPHDRKICLELGAEKYFEKPFELRALMRRIIYRLGKLGSALEEPRALADTASDLSPLPHAPPVAGPRNETAAANGACESCDAEGKVWLRRHVESRRIRWLCRDCCSIAASTWIAIKPEIGGTPSGGRSSRRR